MYPLPPPFLRFDFPDDRGRPQPLSFSDPVRVIAARRIEEVRPALAVLQEGVANGWYAAGYIAYEAAPAFDIALSVSPGREAAMPLLWFGLFRAPAPPPSPVDEAAFRLSPWRPSVRPEDYSRNIARIREAIARGETYQVNYTLRLRADFSGDDFAFYRRLRAAQRAAYSAYLHLGRYRILSVSPELFFHRRGEEIITRPMKGTAPRGRWPEEDAAQAQGLHVSAKNRAENLMIVDLLRSDLGRIAVTGSVRVPRLFEIERYPTVLQMTSTAAATVRAGTTLGDVFAALFPCGSVTGAPKVSTMRLIAALEDSPRGVYCGAIGVVTPRCEALFNVAIRTVILDTRTGIAEYGVGGGVTWDSTSADEYAEALTKAAVLAEEPPQFDLLETLRLEHGAYALGERHLQRLVSSADYFHIPVVREEVAAALEAHARAYPGALQRVRLLVSPDGKIRVEGEPLVPLPPPPLPVALADAPVSRRNRFLFHKTTSRAIHETHRRSRSDVFDVLLWNEEGELTEFTTGNLVVEIDGRRWTPRRDSGLLAGTFRAELLEQGRIQERVLLRAHLAQASQLWLINSVRDWVPVRLKPGCGTVEQHPSSTELWRSG